jgi:hypothetical protein
VKIDPKIDALFQLPLDEFTQKRNALAKELSGESKKQVKFLTKPPLPIWAVNQLYWHERATLNALIDASEKLRAAHRAALSGRKADIRKAEHVHHAALEKAIITTMALLERSQGQGSDAARDTIRRTLAALPTDEDPGRLTRAPEAVGFSLLTGIKPRETAKPTASSPSTAGRGSGPSAVGRDFSRALSREAAARAAAKAEAAGKARTEEAARAREKEFAEAERHLQRARKAAEQARFKVRKLAVELERSQAEEEKLGGEVTAAERKLSKLRIAD